MWQWMFIRSLSSLFMLGLVLNRETKHVLIDSVDQPRQLALAAGQGALSMVLSTYCVVLFPVSIVGITQSLQPLFVVLIAYAVLNERLGCIDVYSLFFALTGAILIVMGMDSSSSSASDSIGLLAYFALCFNPVLLAGSQVSMRTCKSMHYAVVTAYIHLSLLVVSAVFILLNGTGFAFCLEFDLLAWGLVALAGAILVSAHIARCSALKY